MSLEDIINAVAAIHQLEIANAFELLVGRGLITAEQAAAVRTQLQDDLDNQRLMPVLLDLDRVFADAHELSRLYTARFLARSLDVLHVAAARLLHCTRFVSGDDRELAVAKASGLTTVDIKRRVRRMKSSSWTSRDFANVGRIARSATGATPIQATHCV